MATNSGSSGRNYQFKICLLGEGCVGKTSIVLRYVENKFHEKHFSTLQAAFLPKKLNIAGKKVELAIWDTAGQERFHALGPIYYRNSQGALLVYDITDEDSFVKVKNWVKELKKTLGDDVCICIVGNKIDLEKDRAIPVGEAESYSTSVKAKHFLTSAKLNRGIEELFLDLTRRMMEVQEANEQRANSLGRASNQRKNVVIVNDEPQQPKSGCCGGG